MVIDDGSSDGTYDLLSSDPLIASHIRLLRNDTNLGYSQTFARVFAECDTEYLMLVADDDQVILEHLDALLEYLERERPAFVSPQFLRDEAIYRGRDTTGTIRPRELSESSGHASGLVYRVESCRAALAQLMDRVASKQADAMVYPQVDLVARLLIAKCKCEWLALSTVREGSFEPSGIRDAQGRTYWSVESRWQQITSFDAFLTQCVEQDPTGISQEIREAQRKNTYSIIADAIRSENPDLGAAFDRGARDVYKPSVTRIVLLLIFGWLARARRAMRRSG